jgi:hypothetical protein
MPNLNSLVLTSSDYKVLLIIPNVGTFPLKTVETIGYNNAREQETIYSIGQDEPIAQKRNAVKYSGKISMQQGEINAILQSAGLVEATQIAGATLAVTATTGGFSRVHSGVTINTEALDIKAKDKQSIVQLDWTALAVTN